MFYITQHFSFVNYDLRQCKQKVVDNSCRHYYNKVIIIEIVNVVEKYTKIWCTNLGNNAIVKVGKSYD